VRRSRHLIGGNNTGTGSNFNFRTGLVVNELNGDAVTMSGSTQGGNDTLIGGSNSELFLVVRNARAEGGSLFLGYLL
jgi:hypothetical protein